MFLSNQYSASFVMNRKKFFSLKGKGRLQSGDPMTTWFNTLSIITYLNFYLKEHSFKRENGFIAPDKTQGGLLVSGDDQLIFSRPQDSTSVYETLKRWTSKDTKSPNLGRTCDPINHRS